jgi:light-regulated signal transduction histidine kinase (bacteriophytochrome)
MDGLEMVRRIKQEAPDIKVIVMTAFNDIQSTMKCIELGVNQYVIKPVEHRTLQAAIEKCRDAVYMRYTVARQNEHIRALNSELKARAAELETANRELEAFNYTVSHDLRTPLTIINGFCQLLQEKGGDELNADLRLYLAEISQGVGRMSGIIDSLLELSRAGRQDIRPDTVDLGSEAIEILRSLEIADQSAREVVWRIAPGMQVSGDRNLLRQMLVNLLGNAWKYSGRREKARIDFGVQQEEGRMVYFVRDNGAGFDQSQADRLFTPFQRLHDSEEFAGIGIGLATVQRIIQRHGGEIWAEGKEGEGATFYFTLNG